MALRSFAHSARLRLTLLYSALFLALGTAIIAVIYFVGSHSAAIALPTPITRLARAIPGNPAAAAGNPAHAIVIQQHSADTDRLLAASWITLAVTAALSTVLGWFAAGRILRPLRQMTATARTISAGNLHERLAISGPEDEFRQLGDTIDDLLARLEASFRAQRRFVANAAHELRTPLTVERTLLQVALADPHVSAERLRDTCEALLATGRDHERLLDALLTLATTDRGLERREALDLGELASSAVDATRDEREARGLELVSDLATAPVAGDPTLLERLIVNLLDNAARYNQGGGQVEIRTAGSGGQAVLTVANTGRVIPAGEMERLFEPFQRLSGDRTGSDGHPGLGLSIVRAIAAAHRGSVSATPRPGGGLVVTVTIPADG